MIQMMCSALLLVVMSFGTPVDCGLGKWEPDQVSAPARIGFHQSRRRPEDTERADQHPDIKIHELAPAKQARVRNGIGDRNDPDPPSVHY